MSRELQIFDQAKADIEALIAKYDVASIQVTDPQSAQKAIDVAQDLKGAKKRLEDLRKEIVGPLNERVKTINAYVKQLSNPIERGEAHVQGVLNDYANDQLRVAREEQERLERLRREEEAKARAEREAREAELAEQQEAEALRAAKANEMFGTGDVPIEQANEEVNAKLEKEWKEDQARLDQEEAIRRTQYAQQTYDINQQKVKNTRVDYDVVVDDLNLVPKDFLIIEVDIKKAKAAHKLGLAIPGIRFIEKVKVAIGANTYMPLARR